MKESIGGDHAADKSVPVRRADLFRNGFVVEGEVSDFQERLVFVSVVTFGVIPKPLPEVDFWTEQPDGRVSRWSPVVVQVRAVSVHDSMLHAFDEVFVLLWPGSHVKGYASAFQTGCGNDGDIAAGGCNPLMSWSGVKHVAVLQRYCHEGLFSEANEKRFPIDAAFREHPVPAFQNLYREGAVLSVNRRSCAETV